MDRKKLFLVVPFVAIALVVYGVALFPTANADEMAAETDTVAVDTPSNQVQQDTVEGGDLEGVQWCACYNVQECRPSCLPFRSDCTCYAPHDECVVGPCPW